VGWCCRRESKRGRLTSLQQRRVKTGGRLIRRARYYWRFLAESHLTRRLFGSVLRRILALPPPAGQVRQEGETDPDDRGKLRQGCPGNRCEMGQSWPLGSGKGSPWCVRFFGSGTNAEKGRGSGNGRHTVAAGKAKQNGFSFFNRVLRGTRCLRSETIADHTDSPVYCTSCFQ
jgi:hypothetical protein